MSDEIKPKCFVIMPISDQPGYPVGHFTKVYEQIFIPAIEDAGYEADRVDKDNICDSIILKIFDRIQNCDMALCDLSSRNPNVLYELGLRQAYNKPVVLVQDEITERIFDVAGISTVKYRSDRLYENVLDARKMITDALVETKDGKKNSMVNIIKTKGAIFPQGDLSGNEKTEIMIKTIMDELLSLKNDKKIEHNPSFGSSDDLTKKLELDMAKLELEVLSLKPVDGEDISERALVLRNKILSYSKSLYNYKLTSKQAVMCNEKLKRIISLLESYVMENKNN